MRNVWNYFKVWHAPNTKIGAKLYGKTPSDKNVKTARHLLVKVKQSKKKDIAIELLKKIAEIKIFNQARYATRLGKFQKLKSKFHRKWRKCMACKVAPTDHIHHAILLKNGGSNNRRNLISLCEECHSLVHSEWMTPPSVKAQIDQMDAEYRNVVGNSITSA